MQPPNLPAGCASGERIPACSPASIPATGKPGEPIPALDAEGVGLALARAQTAYRAWRTTSIEQRTRLLSAIADRWEADKRHLAEMAVREMGKTITSAIAEVEKCIAGFRHYAEKGPRLSRADRGQDRVWPRHRALVADGPGAGESCRGTFLIGRWFASSPRRSSRAMSRCSSTPRASRAARG
ncbi:MAG: aldehyde dehydrogenase family protein [Sphingomonas sp.]